MNISITGAHGFIGSRLSKSLEKKGFNLNLFDNKRHNLQKPESLKDFLEGSDVVIHLAGANKDKGIEEMRKVNILGTKGLLDGIGLYSPGVKFIFSSSFMVYLRDDVFGATKKSAEDLIAEYVSEKKIKAIILRFANIYGESAKPFTNSAIATFAHKIKQNEQITINGDGMQRRDYVYIDDAINAIEKSIDLPADSLENIDICSGKLVTLNNVLKILEKTSGKELNVCYNQTTKSDDLQTKKDFSKAKKLLNWEPKISLETGLSRFFS